MAILIRMKSAKKDANGPVNQKYGKNGTLYMKVQWHIFWNFSPGFHHTDCLSSWLGSADGIKEQ